MTERLDKLLSDSGLYSRSEARALVRAGRVSVDGAAITAPERKFSRECDIRVDGERLNCAKYRYFLLDKPEGYVCATEDSRLPTVLELLPEEFHGLGLFPVGRLDRDTTGLLLLTNDGDYAHKVISPRSKVEKCYLAETEAPVTSEDAAAFAEGLTLADGTRCLPAGGLEPLDGNYCLVRVLEGKYHQVKRMLASRGKPVTRLRRLSIGALSLPPASEPGELRELDESAKNLALTQL
ncbi:MAG: pseudouridine synthase [Lachnospiraceae bacterium]